MYCEKCGGYIPEAEASFCARCGTPIQKIDNSQIAINNNDISAVPVNTKTNRLKSIFKPSTVIIIITIVIIRIITGMVINEDSNGDSNTFDPPTIIDDSDTSNPPIITDSDDTYDIQFEWYFEGYFWEYSTEIPESEYDYFSNKPRSWSYDEYVLNPYDDESMENIANLFIEEARDEGWDESNYVPFALSFVQSLPYTSDNLTTGYDEYPRYPIETLVDKGGDCEDTSILFASIVREMGYGVALLLLEDDSHMAVGVKISQSFIDNWSQYYPLTYYTASDGDIYAYCETTSTGWGIGEMPDGLVGTAEIIDVF